MSDLTITENKRLAAVKIHTQQVDWDLHTPATIIRSGWFENTQQWEDSPRSLRWQIDGIEYTLATMMPEWGGLTEAELIQIAESFGQE